jgi:hypothetical protein
MPRVLYWVSAAAAGLVVGWFWGRPIYGPLQARIGEAGMLWFIVGCFVLAALLKVAAGWFRRLGARRLAAYRAEHPESAE